MPPRHAPNKTREPHPDPTKTILRCVSQLPWPVGKAKLTQILIGSRAAWITKARLDRLQSYGAARIGKEILLDKIGDLVEMGYLAHSAGLRPTLSLTETGLVKLATDEAGEEPAADKPLLDDLPQAEPVETDADEPQVPFAKGILEENVRRLCTADDQGAMEAIANLRYFRPGYVAEELKKQFKLSSDPRARQQIVWAMCEIPDAADQRFLRNCLKDFDPEVRRWAEAAIKKSAKG
ncbi:MAG: RQC domain-containing protein [Planctomycetota bacterium]